jgi:uncharacterized protein
MKFQPDRADGVNLISRHDTTRIWVGAAACDRSVIVPWIGPLEDWDARSTIDLRPVHFEQLLRLQPELVIFGSGARLTFVAPGLYRALIDARVGIETMDTAAACRTYNVLASEGRSVVAALLLPG